MASERGKTYVDAKLRERSGDLVEARGAGCRDEHYVAGD